MVDAHKEKNAALTGVVTIACLLVSTESATPILNHSVETLTRIECLSITVIYHSEPCSTLYF